MPGRIIAIGDIHGYSAAFRALLDAIAPQPEDTIVALGDYVDRGPDSPGVLDMLIELRGQCRLVPILGNHDEMLLALRSGEPGLKNWLDFGGQQTLLAYGCRDPSEIPQEHADFLLTCAQYHETATHFFVHACYLPDLPLEWQPGTVLRWASLRPRPPGPHVSGKIAILGHTAQRDGEVLDLGHLKCIDTCCYCGMWLTALDVESGRLWQAAPDGRMR